MCSRNLYFKKISEKYHFIFFFQIFVGVHETYAPENYRKVIMELMFKIVQYSRDISGTFLELEFFRYFFGTQVPLTLV